MLAFIYGQAKTLQASPPKSKPVQASPGKTKSIQAGPGQSKPGQALLAQASSDRARPSWRAVGSSRELLYYWFLGFLPHTQKIASLRWGAGIN